MDYQVFVMDDIICPHSTACEPETRTQFGFYFVQQPSEYTVAHE